MDIQMPIMDGLTTTKIRREFEEKNNIAPIAIVALTASALKDDRLAAKRAGINGFASKPVDIDKVYLEIANALGIKVETSHEPTSSDSDSSTLIDWEKGISLWTTKTHLLTELHSYITNYGNTGEQLALLYKAQDWQALTELTHKMIGLTGNLALIKLSHKFHVIEQLVKNSGTEEININQEISEIGTILKQLKIIIDEERTEITTQQNNSANIKPKEWLHLLSEIDHIIEHQGFDEELLKRFIQASPKSIIHLSLQLINSLNDFEYEAAKDLLNELIDHTNQYGDKHAS
jgi:CheY-like chemotaxis protein